jgi:hypothetical protein
LTLFLAGVQCEQRLVPSQGIVISLRTRFE